MKRYITAVALAAALLTASLATAQQKATLTDGEKVMTLNREGQSPRRCQVLRSWKHPSGGMAYEVRAEDTGEIMTVIEHGATDEPLPAVKTAKADMKTDTKVADPILAPARFSSDGKLKDFASDAPKVLPPAPYTKKPIPATQRWLGRKPEPAKISAPMPAVSAVVEARYHPDQVVRLVGALRDDLLPSLREIAAETMAKMGPDRPDVINELIHAAQSDPAPSVRVCCCRCLVGMQVKTPECIAALHTLKADEEPIVRAHAVEALHQLEAQ